MSAFSPFTKVNDVEIMQFKIVAGGIVRRFSIDVNDNMFGKLRNTLRAYFNHPDPDVAYIDDEGDEVALGMQEDLDYLVILARNMNVPCIRLVRVTPGEKVIHQGIICNMCSKEIAGTRFKCITCDDYDMCESCERKGHHDDHIMIRRVRPDVPIPPFVFSSRHSLFQIPRRGYNAGKMYRHSLAEAMKRSADEINSGDVEKRARHTSTPKKDSVLRPRPERSASNVSGLYRTPEAESVPLSATLESANAQAAAAAAASYGVSSDTAHNFSRSISESEVSEIVENVRATAEATLKTATDILAQVPPPTSNDGLDHMFYNVAQLVREPVSMLQSYIAGGAPQTFETAPAPEATPAPAPAPEHVHVSAPAEEEHPAEPELAPVVEAEIEMESNESPAQIATPVVTRATTPVPQSEEVAVEQVQEALHQMSVERQVDDVDADWFSVTGDAPAEERQTDSRSPSEVSDIEIISRDQLEDSHDDVASSSAIEVLHERMRSSMTSLPTPTSTPAQPLVVNNGESQMQVQAANYEELCRALRVRNPSETATDVDSMRDDVSLMSDAAATRENNQHAPTYAYATSVAETEFSEVPSTPFTIASPPNERVEEILRPAEEVPQSAAEIIVSGTALYPDLTPRASEEKCCAGKAYYDVAKYYPNMGHQRQCPIEHPDATVQSAVDLLVDRLGYDNCNGWLTRLSIEHRGEINDIIEATNRDLTYVANVQNQ